MNTIKVDIKSKIFFWLLLGSIVVSVYLMYQKTIVREDFKVFRPESGIPEGVPENAVE